ncbi:hypothetical protein DIPPA_55174 [Diplonema papillatum]|nr:hypothetical protein DIPPA_50087 [Diplonema papillatum]KAJ9448541.1 hypothetical protein DIPPA_55174 [Diplonema papillatum]
MAINAAVAVIPVLVMFMMQAVSIVNEGYVGVVMRGGALQEYYLEPGTGLKLPFLDTVEEVLVRVQTDSVSRIPCGTSGGVMIYFDRIEVVNRLAKDRVLKTIRNYGIDYDKIWIFDKIHHEINQFCSKHTLHEVYTEKFDTLDEMLQQKLQEGCTTHDTGIEIISVRVTKPAIPKYIEQSYIDLEAVKQTIILQKEKLRQQEAENAIELMKRRAAADMQREVTLIEMQTRIMEEESRKKIIDLQNEARASTVRSNADAEAYAISKLGVAENDLLTAARLKKILYESTANNTKIFFGENIPKLWTGFPQS